MDRMMKDILKYMNAQEKPSFRRYNFDSDLNQIATVVHSDKEAVRACIRRLEKYEYVIWIRDQHGKAIQFSLDHKGLHWKEYRCEEIRRYILDNWIDFLAMLFALISLGLSLWNALEKLPCK